MFRPLAIVTGLCFAAAVGGCGTSGGYWFKDGASNLDRDTAIRRCQAEAHSTNPRSQGPVIPNPSAALTVAVGYAIFEGIPHDMAIYRCMERDGWVDRNRSQPIQPVSR